MNNMTPQYKTGSRKASKAKTQDTIQKLPTLLKTSGHFQSKTISCCALLINGLKVSVTALFGLLYVVLQNPIERHKRKKIKKYIILKSVSSHRQTKSKYT
ncbi:MAG: hypothetical protein VX737_05040 [Pseudomonadota bacterium]|nr:hypothetical protein [Pseudomonadota bacterium]